jgi:hypothetical protein
VDEALDLGVRHAKAAAPVGSRPDLRSTPIRDSFYKQRTGVTSGYFGNFARHAGYQDRGTGPHIMIGNPTFQFFWENEGRMWIPGLFGEPDVIHHPGNPATHFMDAGNDAIRRNLVRIARKHYGRRI